MGSEMPILNFMMWYDVILRYIYFSPTPFVLNIDGRENASHIRYIFYATFYYYRSSY